MWLGGRRPRGHIWPFSCLRAYLHVQCPTVVVWFSLYMSLPVLLWRCLVSCVWLAPAVFPPVSRSLIILVYFSPSFHSVRCRDLLHFPAVCSACLISSGVVPVYLVLYFTAVSSKIRPVCESAVGSCPACFTQQFMTLTSTNTQILLQPPFTGLNWPDVFRKKYRRM